MKEGGDHHFTKSTESSNIVGGNTNRGLRVQQAEIKKVQKNNSFENLEMSELILNLV